MGLAFTNLSFLASNATVGIFPDIGLDIGPPVVSGDEFLGFIATWVSCCDSIMMGLNDIFMKCFAFGNVDSFLPFD